MKFRFSAAEFNRLYYLLQKVTISISPKGIDETILHGVLFRLFRKIYARAINIQSQYTITFSDDEACAFYKFFHTATGLWDSGDTFTINLVLTLNNAIHKNYSNEKGAFSPIPGHDPEMYQYQSTV